MTKYMKSKDISQNLLVLRISPNGDGLRPRQEFVIAKGQKLRKLDQHLSLQVEPEG